MLQKTAKHFNTASIVLAFIFLCGKVTNAQHADFNSANIYQKLNALNTFGSILYIGVTPADKNIPLLNYFSKQKNYRTGFMSLTRGENLKNKYGNEEGIELGLVHVAESIEQYKFDGIENFYTTAYDAGAASDEEQLYLGWDTLKILSDIVWIVRNFKPDVIITPFSLNDTTLNSEQKITASLIQHAFAMATDSMAFSDQMAYGVTPWKTLGLFNDYSYTENPDNNNAASINTNTFNALTGLTTTEIANASLQYQKSIYDKDYKINAQTINLKPLAGDSAFTDIMDGIEQHHQHLHDTIINLVQPLIKEVIARYNFSAPEHSVKQLTKLYKTLLNADLKSNWKNRKLREIQNLILLCSGISLKAYSNQPFAVPGDSLKVQLSISKRTSVDAVLNGIAYPRFDFNKYNFNIPFLKDTVFGKTIAVNRYQEATQPYWIRNEMNNEYMYDVKDQYLIGEDEDEPDYNLSALLKIDDTEFIVTMPVEYIPANNDNNIPSQNVYTNLPVIVSLAPNIILTHVKPGNDFTNNPQLAVKFKSNISRDSVNLKLKIYEPGFTITTGNETVKQVPRKTVFETDSIMNLTAGESFTINVPLKTTGINKDSAAILSVVINTDIDGEKNAYSSFLKTIRYNYLPAINYFYSDRTKIIPDEIKTTGQTIGYIYNNNDWLPSNLTQLGYKVKLLTPADFSSDSLSTLAAVVVSSFIQNIQYYLADKYDSVLHYVSKGGNLVFLDSRKEINLNAPFKLSSASLKLPSVNSAISFTQQAKALFNFPNSITTTDLKYWQKNLTEFIFDTNNDAGFQMPLSINYDNKLTVNNAIAIKKYGQGHFIFSGLSLPSQLSSGVASAYKLLPNMISFTE